jgi:hypothetical protein
MANDPSAVQYGKDIAVRIADYSPTNDFPADTVAWDGSWAGSWTAPGYTNGGLHVSTQTTRQGVEVDQELDAIALVVTGRTATMNTNLSQLSVDSMNDATGQGQVVNLAATTAARGYDQLNIDSTIDETGIALGFDILGRDGEPIRIFGPRGFPNAAMQLDFTKNSATGVLTPLSVQLTPSPGHNNLVMAIRDIAPISA